MIQAARSGRQNIAEGSRASATSSQTELRLVNVARASLEELLLDFEDYLRHRGLPQRASDSPPALEVRNVGRGLNHSSDQSDLTHSTDPPDQAATRIADDRRYARYARWLDHERAEIRANAIICLIHQTDPVPQCRRCQALMVLRTAKSGSNAGQQFWGCTRYPECKGTVNL